MLEVQRCVDAVFRVCVCVCVSKCSMMCVSDSKCNVNFSSTRRSPVFTDAINRFSLVTSRLRLQTAARRFLVIISQ